MDKLKEYLLRHKADLDVDAPASDTWENIGSKMPEDLHQPGSATRSGSLKWIVRYAAAACVIALIGGLWLVIKDKKASSDTAKQNSPAIISKPAPEKDKIENILPKEETAPGNEIARNISKPKLTRHKARSQKPTELTNAIDVIDKSYSSLIRYQLKKLRSTPLYAENSSYFSFYIKHLKQMDQDEQDVRNNIKMSGLTNEFLDQLINVYQQKINLLKNLQTEINKMNNKVMGNRSASEKTKVHYLDI
ncbi:MAG TPA: hypothetical protein VGM30_21095 [Puia sp.]|jgi:hypothetical protein